MLCELYLGSVVGEFITKDEIKQYLSSEGFEKCLDMLQKFQDEIEMEREESFKQFVDDEDRISKDAESFKLDDEGKGNDRVNDSPQLANQP